MRVLAVSVARLASSMLAPPCALRLRATRKHVQPLANTALLSAVVLWSSDLPSRRARTRKDGHSQSAFEINSRKQEVERPAHESTLSRLAGPCPLPFSLEVP